ncbi:hypothetical protein ABVB69_23045 [Streptomyces sp. NPDC000349]|uniref:hypothetical protein n=1 Tax=unclassified Streptomyces TaxID=2593676 RepID=UPI0027862971|nr:hypothetical protein [Streptomyces sp. DSM 40167]MDQ0402541.1 hypothetical protein [Streptomyces sp. DSM 40167]
MKLLRLGATCAERPAVPAVLADERDVRLEPSPRWDLGKSCETFNPTGPSKARAGDTVEPEIGGLGRRRRTFEDA